jgi:hypothetical protein
MARPLLSLILTVLLFRLIYPLPLAAQHQQELRFDRFSSEEYKISKGLSQNSVNCIF